MNKKCIFILLFIIFIYSSFNALETLQLDDSKTSYEVWQYLEYYEDKSNKLTIEDIIKTDISNKFIECKKGSLNFGYSVSSYWIRFKIKNNSAKNNEYIIESVYPFISDLKLYLFNDKGNYSIKKNGLNIPLNKKELKNKAFIFNLEFDNLEEKKFYLQVQSNFSNYILLNIYNEKFFFSKDNKENFMLGIYYGIMFIILIISIIIFIFIREKSFLYYSVFFICVIITEMFFNKIISVIFPDSSWYGKILFYPFVSIGLFFVLLFTNNFFNTKNNFPIIHFIIFLLKIMMIISFIFSFIMENIFLVYFFGITVILLFIIINLVGVIDYLKKIRSAIFFLIAWALYFIGSFLFIAGVMRLIPQNLNFINTMQIGSIFLAIFIPIALLDKYNILRKEKTLADKTIAEKEKDKFASIGMLLGGISHEIYNPLSGITGPLDNLKRIIDEPVKQNKDKIKKYIEYIEKNTQRIDNIIKNVRALYKKEKLEKEKLDINEIVLSVIDNYKNDANKNINFEYKIDKKIEIYGDKNAVYQILNNLVSNAIDAINKIDKHGKIIITLEKDNENKIIKVIDNGSGIIDTNIDKIFNAFYSTKTIGNNIGLGLYIVKDLIIKLGWDIKVSSEEGKGTTFCIIVKE